MKNNTTVADRLEDLVTLYHKDPIRSIAFAINQGAADGVSAYDAGLTDILTISNSPVDAKTAIYIEYICFYSHLLNRDIDNELESEKSFEVSRITVGDAITGEIIKLAVKKLHSYSKLLSEEYFENTLISRLNLTENIYSKTTRFAGLESLRSALGRNQDEMSTSFQFNKRVLSIFSDDKNIFEETKVIINTSSCYQTFLTLIDLSEWVKGPIEQLGLKSYRQQQT